MNKFNWYRAKYYQVKKTTLILLAQSLWMYSDLLNKGHTFETALEVLFNGKP